MNILLVALTSIVLSVCAQFSLKAGMGSVTVKAAIGSSSTLQSLFIILTNKFVFLGFVLYGLGAVVWLSVLAKWDVSKAYPLVGLGFALTVLIGFLTGEQVSFMRVVGVALICAGVFVISRS